MSLQSIAYCDESYTDTTPTIYVVSGYLGHSLTWFEFTRQWTKALEEEGLGEEGFHMAHCEHGKGAFKGMSPQERHRLQERFIGIINRTQLWGIAVGIEREHYDKVTAPLVPYMGQLAHPYYLAFDILIGRFANELEREKFSPGEPVSFVFDENRAHQDIALQAHPYLQNRKAKYSRRIGSLSFRDDREDVPLQAADIWAYESRAYFRDEVMRGLNRRWQLFEMMEARRGRERMLRGELIPTEMVEEWGRRLEAKFLEAEKRKIAKKARSKKS